MKTKLLVGLIAVGLVGCAGAVSDTPMDSDLLEGVEETGTISQELSSGVAIGSTLRTTANLNLRTGASTGYRVRLVIPRGARVTTVNRSTPAGGWYNIKYNGVVGWSYGGYLAFVSGPSNPANPPPASTSARDAAISRARAAVGFSYWWGHGRWVPGGLSSSTRGSCTGSCPNCRHSGGYGADCSGFVAKVWQVPASNSDPRVDSHPYSTWSFMGSSSQWHSVSRGSVRKADAMVYNNGSAGHIFLYESGDGWGNMWAYEARGCAIGIVHNLRTASSAYKAIARTGY